SHCMFGARQRHPCLLALLRDIETDAPAGILRTALTGDGKKIDRLSLGRWHAPRAIKLWPARETLPMKSLAPQKNSRLWVRVRHCPLPPLAVFVCPPTENARQRTVLPPLPKLQLSPKSAFLAWCRVP